MSSDKQAKIQETTERILNAFKTGNIAEPLAKIYLQYGLWCERWSRRNQLLVLLHFYSDAATYAQWKAMGRQVRKGEEAFPLVRPVTIKKVDDDGKEYFVVIGFDWFMVFGYEQTDPVSNFEGPAYNYDKLVEQQKQFIDELPLVNVARKWGIEIGTYKGELAYGRLGYAVPDKAIQLGVANYWVWAHELVHQAEAKLKTLSRRRGQDPDNEIVAALGASVLLTIIGKSVDADWGYAYKYIEAYADDGDVFKHIMKVLKRVTDAVDFILAEADI